MQQVSISIVSHAHGEMVQRLVGDLLALPEVRQIIITHNLPEKALVVPEGAENIIQFIHNGRPKGFAENHNAAFNLSTESFFCVLNPDVRIQENPFPPLLQQLDQEHVAMVAPMVVNSRLEREDSARVFPSPLNILLRRLGMEQEKYAYEYGDAAFAPDWVAGMFMLFKSDDYRLLGGFDESYYLYCEDVDICARLKASGRQLLCEPSASVIHDAQRSSHSNFRYLYWHISSLCRFFLKSLFRRF